jgi:hypothetical protein
MQLTVLMLQRYKPGVSKYWLLGLAGLTWSIVGATLCRRAYDWLARADSGMAVPLGLSGMALAVVVYNFGFSKIARNNIDRLRRSTDRTCIFAFQTWKAYLLIGLMMTFSFFLRTSPLPKLYIAPVYTVIGGALFLSSFAYYRSLWQLLVARDH